MKVIEIISEGEGEYKLLSRAFDWGVEKLFGKGLKGNFMRDVAKELTDLKVKAVKDGNDPASVGIKDLSPETQNRIANSGFVKKDPTILDKAEKLANDTANKEASTWRRVFRQRPSDKAAAADAKATADTTKSGAKAAGEAVEGSVAGTIGKAINLIYKTYVAWGFTEASVGAWKSYYQNMTNAEDHLNYEPADELDDDGKPVKWTQSQFDEYKKEQLSILVTRLMACIPPLALGAAGSVLGVASKIPLLGSIAKIAQGFEKAMMLAYITFLNSDTAKRWIVYASLWQLNVDIPLLGIHFKGSPLAEIIGGPAKNILDHLKSDNPAIYNALNAVGGAANTVINKVNPDFGMPPEAEPEANTGNGNVAGQKDTSKPDASKDKNATSQTPDNKDANEPKPSTSTRFPDGAPGTPGSPWVEMSPGKWRNSKTGEITLY